MKLKAGQVYAILTGDYVGEMWVLMEWTKDKLNFLSIPNMLNRSAPYDRFQFGIANRIVEKADKLPTEVFKPLKEQYEQNLTH